MSDSEDPLDLVDEGGEDLFGDEGEDEAASPPARVLDDDELASDPGDDSDARNRDYDDEMPQERVVAELTTYRHRTPKPKDGMVSAMLSLSHIWY